MRLCLFEPDIPQNAGTILRMAACLGVGVDVIEPCGFVFDDKKFRRAGMDYLEKADVVRHDSFEDYWDQARPKRLVLLTTKGSVPYTEFTFHRDDTLMVGRETSGVPDDIQNLAQGRLLIPMVTGARSLNVAVSAAMVLGEALRVTGGFPAR